MFKLARFLKNYKLQSVLAPLFKMLEATFELLVPIVMAKMIDVGIKNSDLPYIYKMGLILVAFGVLGLITSLIAQYFSAYAASGFGTELRSDIYKHINTFSYKELDKVGIPTLITRMTTDINQTQTGINMILRLFLRSPFIVVGAVIMALVINVKLTLIFLVFTIIIGLVLYLITKYTIPKFKKAQSKQDVVSSITRENLSGMRVIRAFAKEEDEKKRFIENSDELVSTQLSASKISSLLNPLTYVLVNIATVIIIWFGSILTNNGNLLQGEVIALVNYMTQILLALIALANLIVVITKAQASATRINELYKIKTTLDDSDSIHDHFAEEKENIPSLEFKNVSFSYYKTSQENALSKISFKAYKGERVGIIGGTGSGKSTLINLIPRFYDVTKGEILINGQNIKSYKFDVLRKKVSVVSQKAQLFNKTIKDNLLMGDKNATDADIEKALKISQAYDFVMEKGLDFKLLQGGTNLSGGQRQRLSIARALISNGDILIFDDSSSALDFATDAKLRKSLKNEMSNKTIVTVSQRISSVMDCDTIMVLNNGEIEGIGTHEELLNSCELYKEINDSQLANNN